MLVWDGYGLQSTHSGIGRHAFELAQELDKLGFGPQIIPSVSALDPAFDKWKADYANFPLSRVKPLSLLAAGYQARSLLARSGAKKALFHGLSNYNIPVLPKAFRTVLTVHDLIPFLFPEGVSKNLHRYLSYQMPKALSRADKIVCVSQWTACSVQNQFPHVKDKILVIPNGKPAARFEHKITNPDKVRLLTISRGETYKRLSLIPEMKKRLPKNFEWHVLTDGRGRTQMSSDPNIFFHQSLTDQAVEELWQHTDIHVHPSLWEGYCLPAVSALSFGIPTLYTGGSGVDEVTADAGVRLTATDDVDDWADAILAVAVDLQNYLHLAKEQWQRLTAWPQVAGQLKTLYDT
ncbi:MAG: glycosyltransferase family 1 protein, partial [Proteobacteria bacterium]